ncbi:MAG: hypothetical protein MI749_06345 [Desulfovibrionales bacterium]|nr:hypothetical protein [Desulfovibrionales bacterium]
MDVSSNYLSQLGIKAGFTLKQEFIWDRYSSLFVKLRPFVHHLVKVGGSNDIKFRLQGAPTQSVLQGRDDEITEYGASLALAYAPTRALTFKTLFEYSHNSYEENYTWFIGASFIPPSPYQGY